MNCELTLDDIHKFIGSKRDNEPIGITCDNSFCLVAEAFQWKYPEIEFWSVGDENIHASEDEGELIEVPIRDDVKEIIEIFDQARDEYRVVTKQRFYHSLTKRG